jgi:hypothetical protein
MCLPPVPPTKYNELLQSIISMFNSQVIVYKTNSNNITGYIKKIYTDANGPSIQIVDINKTVWSIPFNFISNIT